MGSRFLIIPLLFFISSSTAYAGGIYSYITKSTGSPVDATYEYTVESWDEDIDIPNPCYGYFYCYVGIAHRHTDKGEKGGNMVETYRLDNVRNIKTVGELGREYKKRRPLPYSGRMFHQGNWGELTTECVGIYYSPSNDIAYGFHMMPGMVCGVAPPPAGICGFTNTLDVTLDHGPVISTAQHEPISVNIGMSCSQQSKLKLYVKTANNGRLDLQGPGSGVYSILRLNGILADKGLDILVGPSGTNVSLSSQLFTNSLSSAGSYVASAVIVLAVP
ncbi:TPA: hypothetical protein ON183_002672 [Serratia marcescens]|nr:hypothetical protein [Serratia marcescens]HCR2989103.1 hypothetical protein [Serratia marcescens]HCR3013045.1 hypothetical protein [Serratia marcescens]